MNKQSNVKKAENLKEELDSLEKLETEERRRVERLKEELDSLEKLELEEQKKAAKLLSEVDSLELEKKVLEEQDGEREIADYDKKLLEETRRRQKRWQGF
jgi:hypothetical protein